MEEWCVGFRFHPTDEEIINFFLKLKMDGQDSFVDEIITEIDPCRHEPWDLPAVDRAQGRSGDQVWYFYCRLDYKYSNKSKRANRTTKAGYWKATGKVRPIKDKGGQEIGTKRTLVFHRKLAGCGSKAVGTDWVIHEYQAQTILPHQTEYVLWKLKKNADYPADGSPTYDEGEPSFLRSFDLENRIAAEQLTIPEAYTSHSVDFHYPSPQLNMHNLEEISSVDLSKFTNLLNRNLASRSSDDELADNKLADSFLNDPNEYVGEINCTESSDARIHKHEHRTVCHNLVAEGEVYSGYIDELQGDISNIGAKAREDLSHNPAFNMQRKESFGVDSEEGRETLLLGKSKSAKSALKLRSNQSACPDKKGRFILLETPASSYGAIPPSVYILKVLVGLVLFIIMLGEMLILR